MELMVAAALSLVLAALAITIATRTLSSWRRASGRTAAANQAAFVLGKLATDLEASVRRADANAWLIATVQPDQKGEGDADAGASGAPYFGTWSDAVIAKPGWSAPGSEASSQCLAPASGELGDARSGMAGVWLRFFSRVSDAGGAAAELRETSTIRAVSYQLIRRRVAAASGASSVSARRYALFRSEVRPYHESARPAVRSTWGVGFDLLALAYNDPAAFIPGSTERGSSGEAEPGGLRRPDRAQVLADNVIDFGLRLYRRTGDGGWRLVFPDDDSGRPSETNRAFVLTGGAYSVLPGSGYSYAGEIRCGNADAAELFVRVLTEEGARRLEAIERGEAGPRPTAQPSDGAWWWSEARALSSVHTRWVEFRSSGR